MSGAAKSGAARNATTAGTDVLERLGTVPVARFLARYWQRAPLVVRAALPGFVAPVDRARLAALAADAEVESRLVTAFDGRWRLAHGPFAARALPPARRKNWTLLVQGVDLHDPAVAALARRFRFLPAARFDDVMISYAADGGGVGPHVDQYDVFLLQAKGRRRWRIAQRYDPELVEGLPLRVLARFRHEHEWILEEGDLLYLPPGVAHEGVALGESITISVGFRLSPWQEIAEAWYEQQGEVAPRTGRVPDATRAPTRTPGRLPAAMIDATARELARLRPSRHAAQRVLLAHLTEPKPQVVFAPPRRPLAPSAFLRGALRAGLRADLRTRMLYAGGDFAINGELHPMPVSGAAAGALRRLADRGALAPEQCSVLAGGAAAHTGSAPAANPGQSIPTLLHSWYRFGWILMGNY